MTDAGFLGEALVFLLAAVVFAPLFQRLKASPILGFLVGGVVIGPHALGLVSETETTRHLAELGVVFLLFAIGLELSWERLFVMRRSVFGLGLAQVGLTSLLIGTAAYMAGLGPEASVVIGGALALSSTAVVLQLLSERGELGTRFGRTCFAVLLFQDLAVVPLLTLVPALAGEAETLGPMIGTAALKALAAFAVILVAGRLVLRPIYRVIAAGRSAEVLSAVTLLVLLGSSWLTHLAGLSAALGGFLAGLMLAETEYRHQIAADIQPFRGILMGLFFMTVGMSIDLGIVAERLWLVLGLTSALIALKAVVLGALCRLAGLGTGDAVRCGLTLSQGGEFAFLVFILAVSSQVVAADIAGVLMVVVALTMAVTPLLAIAGGWAGRRLSGAGAERAQDMDGETKALDGHVIVAGYGRVGRAVCQMLEEEGVPYTALDLEPDRVARARAAGLPVFYGDAGRPDVLMGAGVARARAAVLTMDTPSASIRAAEGLRARFPGIPIFARVHDDEHRARLEAMGISALVHETAGLSQELGGSVLAALVKGTSGAE
jgi:CPA2 family monovalent cation:H+ antiporter-2